MAISEECETKEAFSSEDREIIVSLLTEYSDKLLKSCERIETHQDQEYFSLVKLFIPPVIVLVLLFTLPGERPIIFSTEFSLNNQVYILVFIFILTVLWLLIANHYKNSLKLQLLKRNAKTLAIKLEKVVRIASQAEEHIVGNFATRIELDLRLADAESALEHYSVISKSMSLLESFF
jgi:low affinity Fe/Cu permease